MEPPRLFESQYTDHAPRGPDYVFRDADVADIVTILGEVTDRLAPIGVA